MAPAAFAQDAALPWAAVYRGAWRGGAVVLTLTLDGDRATARVLLPAEGRTLDGAGSVSAAGEVRAVLSDASDAGRSPTPPPAVGALAGTRSSGPNDDGQALRGTLTLAGRTGPIALVRVAQIATRSVQEGMISASLSYPDVLLGPWAPLRDELEAGWRDQLDAFVRDGQGALGTRSIFFAWQMVGSARVELMTGRVLSLLTTTYRYTGGAHGIDTYEAATYVVEGGKPERVALRDLFVPGADVVGRLQPLILADLARQQADWVTGGDVTSLSYDDLAVFNLVPGGLQFTFPPYAMGPYVQGAFTVRVPAEEVLDLVPEGGVLRGLAVGTRP